MSEAVPSYDVAIIGLGPTGAALANLLGAAGHSVLVLEKEAGIFPLPRAIHFDGEVMRIFQAMGLREEVMAIARPGTQGMHFVNAAGETMLIRGGTAALGPHGCANNYYFHQPQLEAVLRTGLQRFEGVQVQLQNELVRLQESAEGVTLSYRCVGHSDLQIAQARYVVGCDGARSFVREYIATPMVDLGLRQPWLVFDVVLDQPVDLPTYTVQHCDPQRPMTYCNVVGNRRRWEIMVMPGDDREALLQPENLWKMVAPWVRPEQAHLERAAIYTFHALVARDWRKGRVFLAGDACHQTPPFLGQGMCAGVRDASNLAWKLDAVLSGCASDALLNTYESERKPHAQALIELAVRMGNVIQTTDSQQAAERDAKFKAGGPEVFELPSQQLGAGAVDVEQGAPAGTPFPQPLLNDGRWLDELLGRNSAVIGRQEALSSISASTLARWQRSGAVVMDAMDPQIDKWLQNHSANAVVLRPDRYIVGLARTGQDLDRISQYIPVDA